MKSATTPDISGGNELVRCFRPEVPLTEGEQYTFFYADDPSSPDSGQLSRRAFDFRADYDHAMENNLAAPKPWYRTMGLGLFGFVPSLALSGIFLGSGGIIRFRWKMRHPDRKIPPGLITGERVFQLLSLAAFALAVYMIASKGWIIVNSAL